MSGSRISISRVVVAVVVAAVVAVSLGPTVATAEDHTPDPGEPTAAELAAHGTALEQLLSRAGLGAAWRSATAIRPRARGVEVVLDESLETGLTSLIVTVEELAAVERERAEASRQLIVAAAAIDSAIAREQNATVARNVARHQLAVVTAILRIVAVDLFELSFDSDDELFALEPSVLSQAYRTREITESTVEEIVARKSMAEELLARREQELTDAIAARQDREAEHRGLMERQSELALNRASLDEDARRLIVASAEQWVLSDVVGVPHLTPRALDAYIGAELAMAEAAPRCRISWATVAAVSAVEGLHGNHGRATLRFDGTSDPRIIGIALDGEALDNYGNQVASIPDTDAGRWDNDRILDRAVGPMQFIPQEWRRWRRDGDADGDENPHDLDDATIATAAYLCSYGSLRSWDTWNTAVFGYNHSNDYVASVKSQLDRVTRVRLPELDDGIVLQPTRPSGSYVPPPPEPEPETELLSAAE